MFLSTAMFLNKKRIINVFYSKYKLLRILSLSLIFIIVNAIIIRVLKSYIDISFISSWNINEEIKALISVYGFSICFIIVAILVPIYEEVIFRGIIFSSTEKYLGFWKANLIQASLFSFMHLNLSLFIFYFYFWNYFRCNGKEKQGPISWYLFSHAINNSIAVFSLLALMKIQINTDFITKFISLIFPF